MDILPNGGSIELTDDTQPTTEWTVVTDSNSLDGIINGDLGNAQRFLDGYGGLQDIRKVAEWHAPLCWVGTHWYRDDTERCVTGKMSRLVDDMKTRAEAAYLDLPRTKKKSGRETIDTTTDEYRFWKEYDSNVKYMAGASGIHNAITVASRHPDVQVRVEDLNAHEELMVFANGTVNLFTGEIRESRREDLLTMVNSITFDPTATAPQFQRFLEQCWPDSEVRAFLQEFFGMALLGSARTQTALFLLGDGSNGKSVLLNLMLGIFGEFGTALPAGLLEDNGFSDHPTALASLFGKRLGVLLELDEGVKLKESLFKALTGEDKLMVRRMRENTWEFQCQASLAFGVNHLPRITGIDKGIWRRPRIVPCEVEFYDADTPEAIAHPDRVKDRGLTNRLLTEEAPGIVNWLIDGLKRFKAQNTYSYSRAVEEATSRYQQMNNSLGTFLNSSMVVLDDDGFLPSGDLQAVYTKWCSENGENALKDPKKVAQALLKLVPSASQGTARVRGKVTRGYKGLRFSDDGQAMANELTLLTANSRR